MSDDATPPDNGTTLPATASEGADPTVVPQPPVTPPQPKPTPIVPVFSVVQLEAKDDKGNDMVEFMVKVTQGMRYRESIWNEVQTPEIARIFAEMVAAEADLLNSTDTTP